MGIFPFLGQNCVEIKTKYLLSCKKCSQNTKKKILIAFRLKGKTNHKQFSVIFSKHMGRTRHTHLSH